MDRLVSVGVSLAVFVLTGLIGWAARSLVGFRKEHGELLELREHSKHQDEEIQKVVALLKTLAESQRNQIKTELVNKFREVEMRGNIDPYELDCFNRGADSYFALGGNHYIHTLVARVNKEIPIVGEKFPDDE